MLSIRDIDLYKISYGVPRSLGDGSRIMEISYKDCALVLSQNTDIEEEIKEQILKLEQICEVRTSIIDRNGFLSLKQSIISHPLKRVILNGLIIKPCCNFISYPYVISGPTGLQSTLQGPSGTMGKVDSFFLDIKLFILHENIEEYLWLIFREFNQCSLPVEVLFLVLDKYLQI